MNVAELISALAQFHPDMFVYVPDTDGTLQIAKAAMPLIHCDNPIKGISVPPDVVILPLSFLMPEQPEPVLTEG